MKKLEITLQEYNILANNIKFDYKKQENILFEMQCQGYKNYEIAEKLNVSLMTVWRRQKRLMEKIKLYLEKEEHLKEKYCDDEEMAQKYMNVSNTLFDLFMKEHNNIGNMFKSE